MLLLSLIPCGDGGGGIVEILNHVGGVEHHHIADHDQHSRGCGDDTCTPFCSCSCCSLTINIPSSSNLKEISVNPSSKNLLPYQSKFYPSGYLSNVWQPPKI